MVDRTDGPAEEKRSLWHRLAGRGGHGPAAHGAEAPPAPRPLPVSSAALAEALEHLDEAYTLFDAEDRLVAYNRRSCEYYQTVADLFQPGVRYEDLLRAAVARGQFRLDERPAEAWLEERLARHRHPDGPFEIALADGRRLEVNERRTPEGGTITIRRDITDRHRTEEALRQALAFEQTLLDALPYPVYYRDHEGHYLGCNRAFETLVGRPRTDVVGHAARTTDAARDPLTLLESLPPAADAPHGHETTLRLADGRLHHILATQTPFEDPASARHGLIGTLIDLTAQKRAEAQLVQAAKLATLGQIAPEIAHELNQPLSAVRMAVDSLLAQPAKKDTAPVDPAVLHRTLETVASQIARMAALVDHLRVFSRRAEMERRPFSPLDSIDAALRLVAAHFQFDDIDLETDLPDRCPDVMGSANELEQVVINLLSNARDAVKETRPPGERRIRLSLSTDGHVARLTVVDNGGGIPDSLWPSVFEPFFTTKTDGAGTGLGLSVSANIVKAMGGNMSGHNGAEGAEFTLSLPLHAGAAPPPPVSTDRNPPDAPPPPAPDSAKPPPLALSSRGRLLLVDDEPLAVECIAEFLEDRGYSVQTALNPRDALALAADQPIDALLTDLRMPGMGGHQLVEHLRRDRPDLPVLFITGYSSVTLDTDAKTAVIRKPVALDELERRLIALLARAAPPGEGP